MLNKHRDAATEVKSPYRRGMAGWRRSLKSLVIWTIASCLCVTCDVIRPNKPLVMPHFCREPGGDPGCEPDRHCHHPLPGDKWKLGLTEQALHLSLTSYEIGRSGGN